MPGSFFSSGGSMALAVRRLGRRRTWGSVGARSGWAQTRCNAALTTTTARQQRPTRDDRRLQKGGRAGGGSRFDPALGRVSMSVRDSCCGHASCVYFCAFGPRRAGAFLSPSVTAAAATQVANFCGIVRKKSTSKSRIYRRTIHTHRYPVRGLRQVMSGVTPDTRGPSMGTKGTVDNAQRRLV